MPCHKALLLRLSDEINSNYLGCPDVEFRYYSIIRGGPDLPPEEEWRGWPRVISDILRRDRPIERGGWVTIPNSKRVAYQLYFYGFGRDPDLSAFRRFEDQAGRLVQLSRGCLAEAGIDYKIQDHRHNGWMHLCLLLAWDHPDSVNYGITHFTLDDFHDICPSQVGDREQFEAWKRGEIDLPEGYHFIGLSRDIRICSLEAIRLILDLAEESAQRESNNRLMIYPARLGTEPSPAAPPQNFPAEDGGKANELSRTDIPAIRPPDPALPKDEENPNLHVIFPGRLTIDKATKTISLDGENFVVSHGPTFQIYCKVAEAKGESVDTEDLHKIPFCKGNISKFLREHLKPVSEKLRQTIKGRTGGGGYHLILPVLPEKPAKKVRNRT